MPILGRVELDSSGAVSRVHDSDRSAWECRWNDQDRYRWPSALPHENRDPAAISILFKGRGRSPQASYEIEAMSGKLLINYMKTLESVVTSAIATDAHGTVLALEDAVCEVGRQMRVTHDRGNRLFFIGNGGSASISSHMATDYSKNGGMRASALTDGSVLTCLGNDYGYEHVFDKQIEWHARAGDILVAISSSGRSINILNGVRAARNMNCSVYTLSGFGADNPLRVMGDLNFYLANGEYGFVEVGHLALLHCVLDIQMGWHPAGIWSAA